MKTLKRLWQTNRVALIGFGLAALAVVFFTLRIVVSTLYWSNPAHRQQIPEGWMTPGMVARSWHIPRENLAEITGIAPSGERGQSLTEIAARRGIPLSDLVAEILTVLQRP